MSVRGPGVKCHVTCPVRGGGGCSRAGIRPRRERGSTRNFDIHDMTFLHDMTEHPVPSCSEIGEPVAIRGLANGTETIPDMN